RLSGQELILRVAQAYFDVLMAQDNTALAQAQKKAITEQLEQAKRDFEVGTTTITDTYEAQARFDLMNFQEISALGNLEIKRRALQQIVNTSTDELRPLGKEFSLSPPQPSSTEKWVEEAQQNNVQVMAAETAVKLAEKEVTRNLGNHLPTLDLVASFSQNSANGGVFTGTGFDAADTTNKSIGLQFNLPLFQGGATQSKWREADAGRENAKHDLENARRGTALQVRQSYLGVVNAIAQVQALQQALISSESLLEASKLGHAVGVRTNLDVLNAQQQQFSTQRDLLQAKYNYLMSHLRLKAAVGSLSEDDLSNVNRSLY
ncbi:MAG: channel protein TolC, partial [Gallionellales bacterium RIFOXYD2_FULL_52_7]